MMSDHLILGWYELARNMNWFDGCAYYLVIGRLCVQTLIYMN